MSRYDDIIEVHDEIEEVEKFNPYHDRLGRFTSSGGGAGGPAVSFTIQTKDPSKQHWADMAVARAGGNPIGGGKKPEKPKKPEEVDATKPPKGTRTQTEHPPGTHLGKEGIKNITGITDEQKLSDMETATRRFTGSAYKNIRDAAVKGSPPATKEMKKYADDLDEMIDKGPKFDGEVNRGIAVPAATAQQIVAQAQGGHLIDQKGPASFSTSRSTSEDFIDMNLNAQNDTPIMFVSRGTQNGTSVKCISGIPGEDEVLMSSKAMWRPTGKVTPITVSGKNGFQIEMEPFWGDPAEYESKLQPTPLF